MMKPESPPYTTIRVPLLELLLAFMAKVIDHPEMIDLSGLGLPPDAKLNGDANIYPDDIEVYIDFVVDGKDGKDLSDYGDSRLVLHTNDAVPVFKAEYVDRPVVPTEIHG